MTTTEQLRAPPHTPVSHPVEEDEYRATLLAALRSIVKRRILTLYCIGFLNIRHTQYLIDRFRLWGD